MNETAAALIATAPAVFGQLRRHLSPRTALAARAVGHGAVEVAADGCRVRLSDGRTLLDFGSYAVTLLGHRPPRVVEAVQRQLACLPTATRVLANPTTAEAAARLVGYLGGDLPRVWFGLGGADAVEAAVKLARLATGRQRIVAVQGGYHGKSMGALALTHLPRFRTGLTDSLPPAVHVSPDDPEAVARELARGDVAALVVEPIQGENGVRPLNLDILRHWCTAVHQNDAFVIADEMQTGLRRCGDRSMSLAAGLPVDAVLLGKPLGGGVLPLSAMVATGPLYAPLANDPLLHTATFSGHPLACAALPAALDTVEEYAARVPQLAARLGDGLARLREDHPYAIAAVRGQGLLWGVELARADLTERTVVGLARAGLLVSPCLSQPATVRLLPPLVATDTELDEALSIVDCVCARLRR